VQFGDVELRVVGQIDRGRSDPDLGARLRVGGEPSAGRDRKIDPRRRPILIARAEEGQRAGNDADPADAGGRLLWANAEPTSAKLSSSRRRRDLARRRMALPLKIFPTTTDGL